MGARDTHLALQGADVVLLEGFPGLVTVSDVFESLGRILAANIQQDLFTTAAEEWHSQHTQPVPMDPPTLRGQLDRGSSSAGDTGGGQLIDMVDLRVLIDELGGIVDLAVNHHKKVLLRVVLRNVLQGVLLVSHGRNGEDRKSLDCDVDRYSVSTARKQVVGRDERGGMRVLCRKRKVRCQ